jgi:hypothetical protein
LAGIVMFATILARRAQACHPAKAGILLRDDRDARRNTEQDLFSIHPTS